MANKTKAAAAASTEINVVEVKRQRVTVRILGTTPLIFNCMSEKARRELLLPPVAKNKQEKATTLKHNPYAEFRSSPNMSADPKAPTLLLIPATAFKAAICSAAIDLPGSATKAAIGRLTLVEGDWIHVYGVPKLHMAIVRMANIERTPDVRSRAIVSDWACELTVSFVTPVLKEGAVMNLLGGAGITQGVGDFRTQKGKGNFGNFEMVYDDATQKKWDSIRKAGGRKAQQDAMENPECYDEEAAKLLSWFDIEAARREFKVVV